MTVEKLRDEDRDEAADTSYVLGMHVESLEFFAAIARGETIVEELEAAPSLSQELVEPRNVLRKIAGLPPIK